MRKALMYLAIGYALILIKISIPNVVRAPYPLKPGYECSSISVMGNSSYACSFKEHLLNEGFIPSIAYLVFSLLVLLIVAVYLEIKQKNSSKSYAQKEDIKKEKSQN